MSETPGDRLRKLREARGLGVREVARLSKGAFSHAYVSNLENGQSAWPKASLTTLRGFARAFGMSVDSLIGFVANGDDKDQEEDKEKALRALGRMEATPDWVPFPVYGTVSAGSSNSDPLRTRLPTFL